MTINGIHGTNTQTGQTGRNQATDSYSRDIQNRIADAQKQLQELSANEEMTPEEKMRKRQEIRQQISDLNMQLRQHQMEQQKEKRQAKETSMEDMSGGTKGGKSAGLSQAGMTAMISADASIKQSKVQGSVATKMEGRAGVLESEIKLDQMGGQDVMKKQEELADAKQTAMKATASQMETLGEAQDAMKEAAEADSKGDKTAEADSEGDRVSEEKEEKAVSGSAPAEEAPAERQSAAYAHVDVRL